MVLEHPPALLPPVVDPELEQPRHLVLCLLAPGYQAGWHVADHGAVLDLEPGHELRIAGVFCKHGMGWIRTEDTYQSCLQKMAQFKLAQNTKWRSLIEVLEV